MFIFDITKTEIMETVNQPETASTVQAIAEIMKIVLEYTGDPVTAIGILECAKHEMHLVYDKRNATYEELTN
jgi:hypothetical protein